jgi:hypothetical protein
MTHQEFLETLEKDFNSCFITVIDNVFDSCAVNWDIKNKHYPLRPVLTENTYLFHYFENYIFNIATNDKLFKALSKEFKK